MDGYSWHWWRRRNPTYPAGLELLEGEMFGTLLLRNKRINTDPNQHPLAKPWAPPGQVQPLLREGQSPRRAAPASAGGGEGFSPSITPEGSSSGVPKAGGHCQSILKNCQKKLPGRGAEPPWDRRETKGCDKAGREPEEGLV